MKQTTQQVHGVRGLGMWASQAMMSGIQLGRLRWLNVTQIAED